MESISITVGIGQHKTFNMMRTLVCTTKINIHKDATILVWESVGMYHSLEHYIPYMTHATNTNQSYYVNEFHIIENYGICAVCVYPHRKTHPTEYIIYQVWAVPEGQYTLL